MENLLATVVILCSLLQGTLSLIKGIRAPRKTYPWYAQLRVSGDVEMECGATILDDRHVMTSISCTGEVGDMLVTVGIYSQRRPSANQQTLQVRRVFEHPDYNDTTYHNDIAILRTSRMKLSIDVQPAPLSDADFDQNPGMDCWLTGFGVTDQETGETPTILQHLGTMVLSKKRCRKMADSKFGEGDYIFRQSLCTRNVYSGPCTGDLGGPLGCYGVGGDYKLLGILSWGNVARSRCDQGYNVYTRVSQYTDWIDGILN